MITRNLVIILISYCTLSLSCHKPIQEPHNIVFILVDDLGWTDLGYSGSSFYETPHIDDLSTRSVVFTNAYASSPVCSPTRAAIMTGLHPSRLNITDWIPGADPKDRMLLGPQDLNELPLARKTIAEVLKDQGYHTFFAGKWHLGNQGYHPEDQGFDYNFGGHHKGQPPGGYYSPYDNPKLVDGPEGEYLTDRLTDESIKFIADHKEKPFLLFLSYYTVHTPIQASKRHVEKFQSKLKTLADSDVLTEVDKSGRTTLNQVNADYASMVFALDENVGRLINYLKDQDLYENTTIIFTSDNGGLSTLDSDWNRFGPTSVRPLRGGKGWLYEGGIRVPLLVKKAGYNGKDVQNDMPIVSHDLFPTILSLTGTTGPHEHQLDGSDLSFVLNDQDHSVERTIYWDYPHYHGSGWRPGGAIRDGNWKLIQFYETDELELYDLSADLSETNDLSNIQVEKAAELRKKLEDWRKNLEVQRPKANPELTL